MTESIARMRRHAVDIFHAGLEPVRPGAAVRRSLRLDGGSLYVGQRVYDLSTYRHIVVVGAGKATAAMAAAVEEILGDRISGGCVTVKYGHGCNLKHVSLFEAGHPIPDSQGQAGSRAIMGQLAQSGENDLVFSLMSGGGSALLPLPAEGLSLSDKQGTIRELLACGATIHEINTIRKHTSLIKGGLLAGAAYPATVICLILSDVVGDDLDIIASGPTVPDSGTFQDCLDIVHRYDIEEKLPPSIVRHLYHGAAGKRVETPKPGDPVFDNVQNLIVANNQDALRAAREKAETLGYNTLVLSSLFEGETRDAARFHACIAREIVISGNPAPAPACILSGGETTVTLCGDGLGGRNQEFVLAAALALEKINNIVLLSAGTDGTDGPTDAAGAIMDATTIRRAAIENLETGAYLKNNDAYHYFERLGDLFKTGPTRTNVMDLRIMLIGDIA